MDKAWRCKEQEEVMVLSDNLLLDIEERVLDKPKPYVVMFPDGNPRVIGQQITELIIKGSKNDKTNM